MNKKFVKKTLSIMTKNLFIALAVIFCYQTTFAQKASDVLENGNPVKTGQRLFLKYDLKDKVLKVDAVKDIKEVDFTTFQDSIIFLVRKSAINVYLRPLNPLNYTYNTETNVIIDPINEAAAKALGDLFDVLNTVQQKTDTEGAPAGPPICPEFAEIRDSIKSIQTKLTNSKKDEIVTLFEKLKNISFDTEQNTINALSPTNEEIQVISKHFDNIEKLLEKTKELSEKYDCDYPDKFTTQFIFTSTIKDLSTTYEEQKKRLSNLQKAYKLVKEMQEKASTGGETDELKWCIPLNEIIAKQGKIRIYTITINESGYKLSDNKEIVTLETKELTKKSIRIRKFQRFIPEVSVGTAFTFFKYYSYGTTSDSTGQQYVASPTENMVKNINITTMLNLNYYIPNSPLHPLYQIGVGINSGIPTVLTGFGLRSNINGIRRFTIAGGLAMSWLKDLDNLKVGDKIQGTDDIDKDYKYSPAPKFTPYVAIQYNF